MRSKVKSDQRQVERVLVSELRFKKDEVTNIRVEGLRSWM